MKAFELYQIYTNWPNEDENEEFMMMTNEDEFDFRFCQ